LNLKTIIAKCSEGGSDEGNTAILGMAQVLMAYNLAMLTDVMGDVPWSEALQPGDVWTPNLDKQEAIYNDINNFINDAIANLGKETTIPAIGGQDPIYAGNRASWLRFAYGLKARYAMRLSKVKPDYDAVISAANSSFTAKAQEARFNCSNTVKNPFFKFFEDRDYFGVSQSLYDKLEDREDPRGDKFFKEHPRSDDFYIAPNGSPSQIQYYYAISALATSTANIPVYLMSYHELEFLKAEAYARKGDLTNAKTHLKNAVVTAFTNVGLGADVEEYYTDFIEPKLVNQQEAIKEIMMQKYLGLFEGEAAETYCDIRRLRSMGEGGTIPLANPLRFPLRYTYGADDVTTNVNVRTAYGDGQYVYTENVWWAGGTR